MGSGLAVIVLSNFDEAEPDKLADQIIESLVGGDEDEDEDEDEEAEEDE